MKKLILICLVAITYQTAFAAKKAKSVFIKEAKQQEIFDSFAYPAKVEPIVNAMVLSESQGIVEKINTPLGQEVRGNQALVKIRHTDPVFKYRPVTLKAPVDGVISRVFVSEGSLVSKGQKILQVTDPTKVKVKIEIAAKDLQFIKRGLKGTFTAKGLAKPVSLKVIGVSPFVDPATGTASAELEVTDSKELITPGILGKVVFKSNIHTGFVFVENSIYYQGKKTFVRLTQKDGETYKVKKVEVKLGPKRRGQVEVISGLKEGMQVIERASGFLPDGAEVSIGNLPKKAELKTKEVKKTEVKKKVEKS